MAGRTGADGVERIQAAPGCRRLAGVVQLLAVAAILVFVWYGGRLVALFWPDRGDPDVGPLLWLFMGVLAASALTLAWLVVLLHDLVNMIIEISDEGVAVERWVAPFRAAWDEVREIGIVPDRGHLTIRSAGGSFTATERLLGAAPFATLVKALRRRASHAVQEWTPWQALRREVVLLGGATLGAAVVLTLAQGFLRRWIQDARSRRGRGR